MFTRAEVEAVLSDERIPVPGAFGQGAVLEDVLRHFDAAVSRIAKDDESERMAFPPILDRKVFEKSKSLDSFPQLAGSVFSFVGTDAQHSELRGRLRDGKHDHYELP